MMKCIRILMTIIVLCASVPKSSWAEDYPARYLGPGFRKHLNGIIRSGYQVELFTDLYNRQKELVEKRNQVEALISSSYQAGSDSAFGIQQSQEQKMQNAQTVNETIGQLRKHREKVAAAEGEFNYIPHSDGSIVYLTDGLPTTIENEIVYDEFGNPSTKNTFNMLYNLGRLLTSYEANLADVLGNVSHIYTYGIEYAPGAVFYADEDSLAHRNQAERYTRETDSAGSVKLTHWKALSYQGKLVQAFEQTIEDSIYGITSFIRSNITYQNNEPRRVSSYHEEGIGNDGLAYSLERSNIIYNDREQLTGYQEEKVVTAVDGAPITTLTNAQFAYLPIDYRFGKDIEELGPNRLLESTVTVTTQSPDGSEKTETTTTAYNYDPNKRLIAAAGSSVFVGQEANWWQYTDTYGHALSRATDDHGNVTYSYVDPDTLETVVVAEEAVTASLKSGNKYSGTQQLQFEVFRGVAMHRQVHSLTSYYGQNISPAELLRVEDSVITYNNALINNLRRLVSTHEHTVISDPLRDPGNLHNTTRDIITTNIYDERAKLIDAQGEGQAKGWEYLNTRGWFGEYTSTINIDYGVILGKPVRTLYQEDKDYEMHK